MHGSKKNVNLWLRSDPRSASRYNIMIVLLVHKKSRGLFVAETHESRGFKGIQAAWYLTCKHERFRERFLYFAFRWIIDSFAFGSQK